MSKNIKKKKNETQIFWVKKERKEKPLPTATVCAFCTNWILRHRAKNICDAWIFLTACHSQEGTSEVLFTLCLLHCNEIMSAVKCLTSEKMFVETAIQQQITKYSVSSRCIGHATLFGLTSCARKIPFLNVKPESKYNLGPNLCYHFRAGQEESNFRELQISGESSWHPALQLLK